MPARAAANQPASRTGPVAPAHAPAPVTIVVGEEEFLIDRAVRDSIRCEVSRGIREPTARSLLRQIWATMLYVPTDNRLWESTEDLLWQLDRQGIVVPVIDALIAESARKIGAVILTLDSHFQMIPGIIAVDRIV
jgi:predicted nucleic acid-binding protein